MAANLRIVIGALMAALWLAGGSVWAEPPATCRLDGIDGTGVAQWNQEPDGSITVRMMWMATASCPGMPLDGQTAQIRRIARLRPHGQGMVGGTTQILIDITGAGFQAAFQGHVRGTALRSGAMLALTLETHATSQGGAKLLSVEPAVLKIDTTTGEVLSFKAPDYEMTSDQ